jgi:hypothetical protein
MEPKLDLSSITLSSEDDHMGGYEFSGLNSSDTITLSSLNYNNTAIGGGYTTASTHGPFTVSGVINPNTSPYTFSAGTNTAPWFTHQSNTISPKIKLDGEDADIVVNGHSLVDAINSINDRLNCLQINPKLEAEWDELRSLGDQYRELEKQILEKQATWDRLKAMPKVEIE